MIEEMGRNICSTGMVKWFESLIFLMRFNPQREKEKSYALMIFRLEKESFLNMKK